MVTPPLPPSNLVMVIESVPEFPELSRVVMVTTFVGPKTRVIPEQVHDVVPVQDPLFPAALAKLTEETATLSDAVPLKDIMGPVVV